MRFRLQCNVTVRFTLDNWNKLKNMCARTIGGKKKVKSFSTWLMHTNSMLSKDTIIFTVA